MKTIVRIISLLISVIMLMSVAGLSLAWSSDDDIYDMGIPYLNGQVYRKDDMNLTIYWVQVQLKATGIYYQGDIWDETGNLGDHTMQEISAFMKSRGYSGHRGQVDQDVIDELVRYLGNGIVPVYVGGFYRHMDGIMRGGHTGSMDRIDSNLIDMVPRTTNGARWIQSCLSKLGYYTGPIDGKYGEGTDKAVKAFQRAAGFEQRDYVTLGVARAMLEQCYYSGCYLNDLPSGGGGSDSGSRTSQGRTNPRTQPEDGHCPDHPYAAVESTPMEGTYREYNENQHMYEYGLYLYCSVCGKEVFDHANTTIYDLQDHVFNEYNICIFCGYDRGD